MSWIIIVLQLLASLPSIIKVILEILSLIKQQPKFKQAVYMARFKDIIVSINTSKTLTAGHGQALEELLDELRAIS